MVNNPCCLVSLNLALSVWSSSVLTSYMQNLFGDNLFLQKMQSRDTGHPDVGILSRAALAKPALRLSILDYYIFMLVLSLMCLVGCRSIHSHTV
jgi:predicted small integral membrane protein